jgi:hypothetical protein
MPPPGKSSERAILLVAGALAAFSFSDHPETTYRFLEYNNCSLPTTPWWIDRDCGKVDFQKVKATDPKYSTMFRELALVYNSFLDLTESTEVTNGQSLFSPGVGNIQYQNNPMESSLGERITALEQSIQNLSKNKADSVRVAPAQLALEDVRQSLLELSKYDAIDTPYSGRPIQRLNITHSALVKLVNAMENLDPVYETWRPFLTLE